MERLECLTIAKIDVISKDYQTISDKQELKTSSPGLSINNSTHGSLSQTMQNFNKMNTNEIDPSTSTNDLPPNKSINNEIILKKTPTDDNSPSESINNEIILKETSTDGLSPNERTNSERILKESQKNLPNFQDSSSSGMINVLIIFDKLNSF
jgi:hypothetical protein